MTLEETGTVPEENAGADNANAELKATDAENQEVSNEDENPETGKTYTQAEVDALNAKTRKATERKVRRDLEREYANRQPIEQPKIDLKPPSRENFKTDAEFEEARLDFKLELKEARRDAEKARQAAEEADIRFGEKVEDFLDSAEELPGFDREDFQARFGYGYSNEFVRALVESPKASELAEYLCLNEAEAEKLEGMSEARRIAYLGTIEARLVKQTKSAGDQVPTVKGGQVSSTLYKTNPGKLTDDQWYRERTAEREKMYGKR